jgi:hypothetical protein
VEEERQVELLLTTLVEEEEGAEVTELLPYP